MSYHSEIHADMMERGAEKAAAGLHTGIPEFDGPEPEPTALDYYETAWWTVRGEGATHFQRQDYIDWEGVKATFEAMSPDEQLAELRRAEAAARSLTVSDGNVGIDGASSEITRTQAQMWANPEAAARSPKMSEQCF